MRYLLPAFYSGMLDPETEKARQLTGLKPKYPVVTLDSLENVYPPAPSGRPFNKESLEKYRTKTEGLRLKNRPVIYINRGARPYREHDTPYLASVLEHENEHALGGDELQAHQKQVDVLNRIGYKKNSFYESLAKHLKALKESNNG